jgi:hypothetical protein
MHFGPDKYSVNYGCLGCLVIVVLWAGFLYFGVVTLAARWIQ